MKRKQKEVLKGVLDAVPQVKAWTIIRESVNAEDMAQRIIQAAGIACLTPAEQAVVTEFMLLDKDARTQLAGELIGQVIEEVTVGILGRILAVFRGWFA